MGYVMRRSVVVSIFLVAAATAVLFLVIPAQIIISVGDDLGTLRKITLYGYPRSYFCVINRDANGRRLSNQAFSLGDGWQLLVWYRDKIHSMTFKNHFLSIPMWIANILERRQ